MKVLLSELEKLVGPLPPAETVAKELSIKTTEITGIEKVGDYDKNIIAAKINKIWPHPNAQALKIAEVTSGKKAYQIVCGGINLDKDKIGILALPGAILPTEHKPLKVTVIRGVRSEGMLCNAFELGLPKTDGKTIDYLKPATTPGSSLRRLVSDIALEYEVLSNRPDLAGSWGIARELSAIFRNRPFAHKIPQTIFQTGQKNINIALDPSTKTPGYYLALINDITINQSYFEDKLKLNTLGIPPINNVVDATNLALFHWGQPLHPFDADKSYDNRGNLSIRVRNAHSREILTIIGSKNIRLESDDIVIDFNGKSVALAGIIGGADTEISPSTTRVLIESANFNPTKIRRSSRRLGLQTIAANRFERGSNLQVAKIALADTVRRICELEPGSKPARLYCAISRSVKPTQILYNRRFIVQLANLPTNYDPQKPLRNLGFTTHRLVQPPLFRPDISQPNDLLEEVARIYDLNRIKSQPLIKSPAKTNSENLPNQQLAKFMTKLGFYEIIGYPFRNKNDKYLPNSDFGPAITNPISGWSAIAGEGYSNLLAAIRRNRDYLPDCRYFELTKRFDKKSEIPVLSFAVQNSLRKPLTNLKPVLESLFMWLKIQPKISYRQSQNPAFSLIWQINFNNKIIGLVGELSRSEFDRLDLFWPTGLVQIDTAAITKYIPTKQVKIPISKSGFNPDCLARAKTVDIAFTVLQSRQSRFNVIINNIASKKPNIKRAIIWDIFKKPAGQISITVRFYLTSTINTKTIRNEISNAIK